MKILDRAVWEQCDARAVHIFKIIFNRPVSELPKPHPVIMSELLVALILYREVPSNAYEMTW